MIGVILRPILIYDKIKSKLLFLTVSGTPFAYIGRLLAVSYKFRKRKDYVYGL